MLSILLIDDEPDLIRDLLKLYGYQVDVKTDGYSGLEQLGKADHSYDLVILDVKMPQMDGWTTLKCIRKNTKDTTIPVIMLTSSKDETCVVSGLRKGADLYLTKPIEPSVLFAHIEALTRRIQWEETIEENPVDAARLNALTKREKEILKLVSQGCTNQEIAETLGISLKTVKNHVVKVLSKLDVSNRTQASCVAQSCRL